MESRLNKEYVARNGEIQPGGLTLGVQQKDRDVGILLESLDDAFLLALACLALETDVSDSVAREGLHEQRQRLRPSREDDDLGIGMAPADKSAHHNGSVTNHKDK